MHKNALIKSVEVLPNEAILELLIIKSDGEMIEKLASVKTPVKNLRVSVKQGLLSISLTTYILIGLKVLATP
ncbi:MAG: hypothetical protein ACI84O_001249 [Myxococcota bacterium]|jgi:hypothetical protein